MVTAVFSKEVTWERAPSATCSEPTPSFAFWMDWLSAAMFAERPFAMASPAGSSEPELMRCPVANCCRVVFISICVVPSADSACRAGMLLRIPIDISERLLFVVWRPVFAAKTVWLGRVGLHCRDGASRLRELLAFTYYF